MFISILVFDYEIVKFCDNLFLKTLQVVFCLLDIIKGIDVNSSEDMVNNHRKCIRGHYNFLKPNVVIGEVEKAIVIIPHFHVLRTLAEVVIDELQMSINNSSLFTKDGINVIIIFRYIFL